MSPPARLVCLHVRQSARLSFDATGLLHARLICDDCPAQLRWLAEQTAQARQALRARPPAGVLTCG